MSYTQNPVKHLRWSVLQKTLTAFSHYPFLQNAPSYMFDRVLNTPLCCPENSRKVDEIVIKIRSNTQSSPSYSEQSIFAIKIFFAVPGIISPVTVLTHQHEAADGLHCFALKLPSSLQSGGIFPTNRESFAAASC